MIGKKKGDNPNLLDVPLEIRVAGKHLDVTEVIDGGALFARLGVDWDDLRPTTTVSNLPVEFRGVDRLGILVGRLECVELFVAELAGPNGKVVARFFRG